MSEKRGASLNGLDMKTVVASWIIANDGCCPLSEICCDGGHGLFSGTRCPLRKNAPCCLNRKDKIALLNEWLKEYRSQKAEAAKKQEQTAKSEPKKICTKKITAMKDGRFLVGSEIVHSGATVHMESPNDYFVIEVCNEKLKSAAKEQERGAKPEPVKICGACRNTPEGVVDFNQIVLCEKRGRMAPASFDSCSYFEPRTGEKSVLERLSAIIENRAEAGDLNNYLTAASLFQAVKSMSGAEKEKMQDEINSRRTLRRTVASPPDVSISDFVCALVASAPSSKLSVRTPSLEAERIAKLEKENAELQKRNAQLREELVWQFEQLMKKIGTLRDQCDRIQAKFDAATKEKGSADCRLAGQLKQMGQRIKDLEREANERSWPPRPRFFL